LRKPTDMQSLEGRRWLWPKRVSVTAGFDFNMWCGVLKQAQYGYGSNFNYNDSVSIKKSMWCMS
jgi:hypothetical protein